MSRVGLDAGAAADLAEQIVDVAADVDDAGAQLTGQSCLGEPAATGAALTTLLAEFGSGLERLRNDVVALGRLVQVTAADFEDVDAAAAAGLGG